MTIPLRTAQANPFTPLEHDDIHEDLDAAVAALNAAIVSLQGGAVPVGTVLEYGGSTLPTGYLWANGDTVSTTTYANLFAVYGTTYNTGGEPVNTFRLPKHQGRTPVGTNPMGGITDATLTARALGARFGAETYTDSLPVTGDIPSMTVSFSSMGSITFQTFSAGAYPSLTGGALPSLNAGVLPSMSSGTLPSLNGGTLPSSTGGEMPTLDVSGGGATVNAELISGLEINGAVCVAAGVEGSAAMDCNASLTVEDFTPLISKTAILGALTLSAGSFPAFDAGEFPALDPGSFPVFTVGSYPTLNAGSFQTLTAGTPPSVSGGNSTVTGAAATTPETALDGVTAEIDASIVQPGIAMNFIIKH